MWTSKSNYIIQGNSLKKELNLYHLILAPTYDCNLRCKHCYLPNFDKKTINSEKINSLISDWSNIVMHEKGEYGGVIHIKGGEPLVMQDFENIIEKVSSLKSLRLMITTNGSIIKKSVFNALKNATVALKNNVIVNVSLDGSTSGTHDFLRGKGSFTNAIDFINRLKQEQIPTHINFVVHKGNLNEVNDVLKVATEHDVRQVNFLPFVAKNYGESIISNVLSPKEFFETIENIYINSTEKEKTLLTGTISDILRIEKSNERQTKECVAGYKGFYYIVPDGSIFTCPNLMEQEYSIGNINEVSIKEVHSERIGNLYHKIDKVLKRKEIAFAHDDDSETFECAKCDRYNCKGALIHYSENKEERIVREYNEFNSYLENVYSTSDIEELAFCFSRNI